MPFSHPAPAPHPALSALFQTGLRGTICEGVPHFWLHGDAQAEQPGTTFLLPLTPPGTLAEGMSSWPHRVSY